MLVVPGHCTGCEPSTLWRRPCLVPGSRAAAAHRSGSPPDRSLPFPGSAREPLRPLFCPRPRRSQRSPCRTQAGTADRFRTGWVMTEQPGWAPPGVDPGWANTARVDDDWLGGSHNFLADEDLGLGDGGYPAQGLRAITRANRAFLGRSVRFLAANGIRQFLDIGSGIPTQANRDEVAQADPPPAPASRTLTSTRSPSRTAKPSWSARAPPSPSRPTCATRAGHPRRRGHRPVDWTPAYLLASCCSPSWTSSRTPRIPGASWPPCGTRWRLAATSCSATAPTRTIRSWPGPPRSCTTAPRPPPRRPGPGWISCACSTVSPWLTRARIRAALAARLPRAVPAEPSRFANLVGVARKG